jgi:hypothetical protein
MNQALVGRGIAAVGVVLGFVAIFVDFISVNGSTLKYSDDGTILAFLLVSLILTAILMAANSAGRDGLDAAAAVAGSTAFGFYLFIPAGLGFNHFDYVATGGWLGVCTVLIPLGLWYSLASRPRPVTRPGMELVVPAILGRILCLIAIWLTAEPDLGKSYWNLVDEGRALPALMLLLVIGGAALGMATTFVAGTRVTADGALILAAVTFGLYAAEVIASAFNTFGSLGAGAWLGSAGALVLLVSVVRIWQTAVGGVPAARSASAMAPPAV